LLHYPRVARRDDEATFVHLLPSEVACERVVFSARSDEPDDPGERTVARPHVHLLANFNVQQDQQAGALTGEFGKDSQTGSSHDPAILTDACRGAHRKHGGDDEHADGDQRGGRALHQRTARPSRNQAPATRPNNLVGNYSY
jgi:hypothetical protein